MAIEHKRRCGYRKVGKMYIVGEGIFTPCDRLPYPIGTCPVCGAVIPLTRGIIEINPLQLFGFHQPCSDRTPDAMCCPMNETAYIMTVGEKYYPSPRDFVSEAVELGVSKAIPAIPRKLVLGKTLIFLCHPKAIEIREPIAVQQAMSVIENYTSEQPKLFPLEVADRPRYKPGIFMVFVPRKIQRLCWQSEYTDENIEKNKKMGVELVPVPDGDRDHA